jgi:uncharacterized protein (TIGR03435 family)
MFRARLFVNMLILVGACVALAQNAAAPAFDVASIKRSAMPAGSRFQYLEGGRFLGMTWIKQLVQVAYDLPDYQVSGGPAWLITDRYEIEAKAEDPQAGAQEMKLMLRSLLADRFKLTFHREIKEFPVYGLIVDKGGPKLKPLKPGERAKCRLDSSLPCDIWTMARLAEAMRYATRRPVFDQTGLVGEYDVVLTFDEAEAKNQTGPADSIKPPPASAIREQLGLRLDPQKASLPVIVIDDIQRPTAN